MNKRCLPAVAAVLCLALHAVPARAGIVYQISIDTSSISGTAGYLDLQFSSGPGAPSALATVSQFTSDATLGTPSAFNTTGSLVPGGSTLEFDNQTANDYLQGIDVFGNSVTFLVTLSGAGVDTPPGIGSGSTFGLFLYDTSFNPILNADPGTGLLGSVDLNNDGTTTPASISPQAQIDAQSAPASAPEPGTQLLLGLGAIAIGTFRRVRK